LRWELHKLQETVHLESIDGARTYGLSDADRILVGAFMRGETKTAALKFDHPGLDTTATRDGDPLTIQNDLGATDVRVIAVHVVGLSAAVIYTDRHSARARFLRAM